MTKLKVFNKKILFHNNDMISNPFDEIKEYLLKQLPNNLVRFIPSKWEKVGNVVIIVLPPVLNDYKKIIGKTYANILVAKSVLNDFGGITGSFREPNVELIYGDRDTVTIHKENKIRFKLDPRKVMFSSGNMDERIRISKISNMNEVVVDLFAGIGYFTIPIAVYSKPKKIYAYEINTNAYKFLCENILLNDVSNIVKPFQGDNRIIASKDIANRVVMGYIGNTHNFLPTAFNCLKNHTGIIHFHDKYPEKKIPEYPIKIIKGTADNYNLNVELLSYNKVKSFAPGISHYVFDLKIDEK